MVIPQPTGSFVEQAAEQQHGQIPTPAPSVLHTHNEMSSIQDGDSASQHPMGPENIVNDGIQEHIPQELFIEWSSKTNETSYRYNVSECQDAWPGSIMIIVMPIYHLGTRLTTHSSDPLLKGHVALFPGNS